MLQTLYALYSEPQTKDVNVLDAVDQIIKRYWDSFENGDSVELVESDILDSATDKMSMISSQKSIESFKSETEATTPKLSFSTITENIQVLDLSGGTIQVPDKVDFSHTDSMQPDSPTSSIDETASFYSTATTESQPRLGHKQSVYFDALDLSAEEKLESLCISLDNSVPTTPSIIKDNADKWFWKLFRAS
jgi:hypothetical protein